MKVLDLSMSIPAGKILRLFDGPGDLRKMCMTYSSYICYYPNSVEKYGGR